MTAIIIGVDIRDLMGVRAIYDSVAKSTPGAISRAMNWTGDKSRTAAARTLSQTTGLPYGRTRAELYTRRASSNHFLYAIGAHGRALGLAEFRARQTQKGVTAAPWGERRLFPHTFIVEKLGGQVFKREGKARLPIRKLFGPSIPNELVSDAVTQAWRTTAEQEFAGRVLHEMERLFPQNQKK